ncbi:hypothetical protein O6H91_02G035300 [Diphasiastrum complanatum]|uniref:Uncharacterized protein n=1 Tax=Diphasiastrum complanatum TaxID=34168 RepID=A0ACC2EEB0_DIPCM|nr:hypothetical protein O6H91_02G035300 [Diphasiastrum complanatum]
MAVLSSIWGTVVVPPPLPLQPIPSASQITFQMRERAMFFHFGMNTFTNVEVGTGLDDPRTFYPKALNTRQWVRHAKEAGFKLVILTAKHHDGFCLWPSAYTKYSVQSSLWMKGTGDVVRELAAAVREEGLEMGLYLSPWDRHESTYGQTIAYNELYLGQLHELLTRYDTISEVWLDGAKGNNTPSMEYKFRDWFTTIRQLQPGANIFSDAGPDTRWVGDEQGQAGSTCWSMVNRSSIQIGGANQESYLNHGDIYGRNWVPPECDVSIRSGWFWHADQQPKTVESLLDIYYKSVGRNCVLLLNVPPNSTGLLPEEDVKVLHQFNAALKSIFSNNLASDALATSSSIYGEADGIQNEDESHYSPSKVLDKDIFTYWAPTAGQTSGYLQFDLQKAIDFNVVEIQEAFYMGQRVMSYNVDMWKDGSWYTLCNGTTIGYKKLDRFPAVKAAQRVRLVISKARDLPLIASFSLYLDKISPPLALLPLTNLHQST